MRVKLSVVNTEREAPPRTYVFEQDTIVIGRAGTCDLPLDDPNRVVSKRHSELRVEGDALRVFDMGSKNHTFLDGARVGTSGSPVTDGNKLQLGPFEVVVEIDRDRLVADDLDRTVFGAAFANPFEDQATALASALSEVRRVYQTLDYDHRDAALEDALRDHLGADAPSLTALVSPNVAPPSDPSRPTAPSFLTPPAPTPPAAPPPAAPTSSEPDLDDLFGPPIGEGTDPFAPPPIDVSIPATPPAPPISEQAIPVQEGPDDLHRALAAVVARLISIPGQFRHEFLGHTVIHAPETAFLFDADVSALLGHLTPADPGLRAERLAILDDAAEAVLEHHQALLEGYRAAARDGAAVLVNGLDPDQLSDQASGGGLLQGGKDRAVLDLVRERCAMMKGEDFAAAERRVYRPAFSSAYLNSLAHSRASRSS